MKSFPNHKHIIGATAVKAYIKRLKTDKNKSGSSIANIRLKYILILLFLYPCSSYSVESICYGTTSKGSLKDGVKLPSEGKNFEGYSSIAAIAGRTYVHTSVRDIIVGAYKRLEKMEPSKIYKYAETGFKGGGQFNPHKTHQNGLSVDFMTPVLDDKQISVHLPTHPFNKFGYNIEFDNDDKYEDYSIDYVALAAHIVALHKESEKLGLEIWRVIFDPQLQTNLLTTKYGDYLKANIQFSKKRSWVRHDEHFHVDFSVPCK